MIERIFTTTTVALLSGVVSLTLLRAEDTVNSTIMPARANGNGAQTEELQPFTHVAYIPADADPTSIRFSKMRLVNVASKISYAFDRAYCEQLAFRDPGGSIACPSFHTDASVPAYEVTYSYVGEPLPVEDLSRDFTFSVYFRMDELAPGVEKALSVGRKGRSEAATYFAVTTKRETIRQVVIDNQHSILCDGTYSDGAWTHTDPGCQDHIAYSIAAVPSGYLTVQVDPLAARIASAKAVK